MKQSIPPAGIKGASPAGQTAGNLVEQVYWDHANSARRWSVADRRDPVRQWIEQHIPAGNGADCFEVGCVPGRYLAVLGMRGYRLNGIDLTPRVYPELRDWLSGQGYPVGDFVHQDFGSYQPPMPYQLVCSFGFLEHFVEWEAVLLRHAEMVREGGYIVVTTPNFRGAVQRRLHQWFDAESLARHNLDAMQPNAWSEVVQPMGFRTIRAEHFGRFDFWREPQARTILQRVGSTAIIRAGRLLRALPAGIPSFAPYCGFIARREG